MGICPRCGSWVDEGDVCRSCGGVREVEYGGYDEYDEGDEEVYDDPYVDLEAIRYSADEKLESAMFETRANHNLKEAMRLVNSAIDEIGSYSELNDLKQWALSLKAEIKGDMEDVAAYKRYEGILKRKGRDKLVHMCGYDRMFNSNDLVFRLVKEKSGFINVCYGDMKIGYVSENWGHEICYSSVSELTNLPKVSYAKYFCRYPGRYNYVPDSGWVILELLDDYSPRKYWTEIKKEIKLNIDDDLLKKRETEARKKVRQLITINQHSKKDLITIVGTSFQKQVQFKEGMKLKLVKEPDNSYDKDAIAVYVGSDKVGYVANSKETNFSKSSMASELKNLPKISYARYLTDYFDYHIAKLKWE